MDVEVGNSWVTLQVRQGTWKGDGFAWALCSPWESSPLTLHLSPVAMPVTSRSCVFCDQQTQHLAYSQRLSCPKLTYCYDLVLVCKTPYEFLHMGLIRSQGRSRRLTSWPTSSSVECVTVPTWNSSLQTGSLSEDIWCWGTALALLFAIESVIPTADT